MPPVVQPFKLPLTPNDFADAVAKGHGRAMLHVQRCGIVGMEEVARAAALSNAVYDPQSEDFRSDWIFELLKESRELWRAPLLDALAVPGVCWRDFEHRIRVVGCLARERDEPALQALYAVVDRADDPSNLPGAEILMEIDREKAALAVIQVLEKQLSANEEDVPAPFFEDQFVELLIQVASTSGSSVELLDKLTRELGQLRNAERTPAYRRHPPTRRTIAEALALVDSSREHVRGHLAAFGRHATDDELEGVLSHLLLEKVPKRISRLLACFGQRPMPRLEDRIVELAAHEDSEVRAEAFEALRHHKHERIRQHALCELQRPEWDSSAIQPLIMNHQVGDVEVILNSLSHLSHRVARDFSPQGDKEFWPDAGELHRRQHWTGYDIVESLETVPDAPHFSVLAEWVYEYSPCSNCRRRAFEFMKRLECAPSWMLEEARHDGDEDTRSMAIQKKL